MSVRATKAAHDGQETPSTDPRGAKKAVTQARILDSALALFARRGFEATSITAIAGRAGVSRAAVFWHFGDKQHLFQEACRQMLQPFITELAKSLEEDDPRQRLFQLFNVYEEFVSQNRSTIEAIVRWVLESPSLRSSLVSPLLSLHDEFTRDLRHALDEIIGDPEQAAALAAGLMSLLNGNLLLSLLDTSTRTQALRRAGLRALAELTLQLESHGAVPNAAEHDDVPTGAGADEKRMQMSTGERG
jgi:AcrR family transcriptional regulator